MPEAIAILSGGLDSCTLVQKLLNDKSTVLAVSFDYGQRHLKELDYAAAFCAKRGVEHHVVDLSSLNPLLGSSALVGDTEVPDGHYAENNMKATVVPNRNMIMLSIAGGIAVAHGGTIIATGVHAGDHFIYPDCRPAFISAVQKAIQVGNEGLASPYLEVFTPFKGMTKAQIAYLAYNSGVAFDETWSCYKGEDIHCGRCGTCVERLEAIYDSGYSEYDTTEYADTEYWKEAVAEANADAAHLS
jgi:7-cyano-7-deazaguanine synthase